MWQINFFRTTFLSNFLPSKKYVVYFLDYAVTNMFTIINSFEVRLRITKSGFLTFVICYQKRLECVFMIYLQYNKGMEFKCVSFIKRNLWFHRYTDSLDKYQIRFWAKTFMPFVIGIMWFHLVGLNLLNRDLWVRNLNLVFAFL